MSDVDGSSSTTRRNHPAAPSGLGATEVRDRLAELPDAVAEALRLLYFGRLDHREIGVRTGMSEGEVWTALRVGLLQLGRLLQGV